MKLRILATAVLLAGGTAALAQQQDDSDEQQAQVAAANAQNEDEAEEEDPGEEVICRTERVTGSLTRRTRTCMTRNEWNGVEARTRDEMNRMGRRASGGSACRPDQMAQGGC